MSKLDDELRQAVEESEATATVTDTSVDDDPETNSEGKNNRRNLGLLLGLLVIGGGILSIVLGSPSENLEYSKQVTDVLKDWDDLGKRNLTVEGFLVHGSLMKRDEPCEYRFKLRPTDLNQEGELSIRYESCIVPDTFRDVAGMDVNVTATGRLDGDFLRASKISTKCPTKYEMEQRKALGEQAPHQEQKVPILGFDNEG